MSGLDSVRATATDIPFIMAAERKPAYQKPGFRTEGISRSAAFLDGQHLDEVTMAVLRPEWRRV